MAVSNAVLKRDVEHLTSLVEKIDKKLAEGYITRVEFDAFKALIKAEYGPVRLVVFWVCGLVGTGLLGTLGTMMVWYLSTVPGASGGP